MNWEYSVSNSVSVGEFERLRFRFLQALCLIGIGLGIGGLTAQLLPQQQFEITVGIVFVFIFIVSCVVAFILTQRGATKLPTAIILGGLMLSVIAAPRVFGYESVLLISGVLFVILAAILIPDTRIFALMMTIVLARFIVEILLIVAEFGIEPSVSGTVLVTGAASVFTVGIILRYFVDVARQTVENAQRVNTVLENIVDISQVTSQLLDMDVLMNRSVDLIRERFGVYHAQIFIVDENREYANLVASTGDIGKRLLARGHRLAVGSQSVIGRVTQVGEAVIARDTDRDTVHAMNELLPDTRAELALPMNDERRIIGALDVQSDRANAFSESDIKALQVLANQIAVTIRNARLFEVQETNIDENKRLFFEAQARLRDIERLNRQLTRQAWERYLHESQADRGVTIDGHRTHTNAEWTPNMADAVRGRRPTTIADGEQHTVAVPIMLRNEVLGAIEVQVGEVTDADFTEMVEAVAQRLAVALENIRLFEEAQEATTQEQRINMIVEGYQSAVTVDELLKITLRELGDSLGVHEGKIRLGLPSQQTTIGQNGNAASDGYHNGNTNGYHDEGDDPR